MDAVTIDMGGYARLGDQRRVFDDWLREVGLMDRSLVEIRFGEGVHHCWARAVDLSVSPPKAAIYDFDWVGPLPPISVLERAREVAGWTP